MRRKTIISLGATLAVLAAGGGYGAAVAGAPHPDRATLPSAAMLGQAGTPRVALTPTVRPEQLFVPITTCRAVNTSGHGGAFAPGQTRVYAISGTAGFPAQGGRSGGCGIPASATAFTGRLTTVAPTASGTLIAYAHGVPVGTGAAYYTRGITSAAGVTQAITPNSSTNLTVKNASGRTNLIIDVTGYFVPQIEAQVSADGTITSGTSRVLDVVKAGTGFYYVDIDRDARSCSVQATTYNVFRYASAGLSSTNTPNRVSIFTWQVVNGTYSPVDYPFHVLVTC